MTDFLPSVGSVVKELVTPELRSQSGPTVASKALTTKVVVYYLADDVTERERRMVMTMVTLCGRADDNRPQCWQTFVLTFALLCFPELVQTLKDEQKAVDYSYVPFSKEFVKQCEDAVIAQTKEESEGSHYVQFPPALPNASTIAPTPDLVSAATIEGLYGYYSMLVFVMGKSISAENMVALTTKRPSALIRRRMLQSSEYLLIGEGKPASVNYSNIQSGWIRSNKPRIAIVIHHAKLYASDNRSETLDVLIVNMDMLKNSGQTYMFYIHELLVACPWCIELPALRSAFYHYAKMVKVLHSLDSWMQPYYKLAMQDTTKDVGRKNIEALVSVSTFFASQTKRSMAQYRINKDTYPVVNQFRELAASKGMNFHEIQDQKTTEVTTAA